MLKITIPGQEFWDEGKGLFVNTKDTTLQLEHSLISLSKWESRWHKPFLGREDKTMEETMDYIRCMTVTRNVDPLVYDSVTNDIIGMISRYIDDSMTATWFSKEDKKSAGRDVITAEIIYYWMIAYNIPFECQKWNLNRLLTLIRVCSVKNASPKKNSKKETLKNYAALNAARRKALKTKG